MKREEGFRVKDTWALSKQCTMGQQTRQTFLQWKSLRTKRVSKVRLIDVTVAPRGCFFVVGRHHVGGFASTADDNASRSALR